MNKIKLNKNEEKTELEECVCAHFSQIKQLNEELDKILQPHFLKIKEIQNAYESKIKIFRKNLNAMRDRYSEIALELAYLSKEVPRKPLTGYYEPTSIKIQEDGIHIEWTIDSYMYDQEHYFTASWQQIDSHIKKEKTEK